MKKILIPILVLICLKCSAQVEWTNTVIKLSSDTYEIHLKAKIQRPWHIYSQYMTEGGPIPTKILFNDNHSIKLIGKAKEIGQLITKHETVFNMDVKYFEQSVDFVQVISIDSQNKTEFSGTITYMLCEQDRCLPPVSQSFSIKIQ